MHGWTHGGTELWLDQLKSPVPSERRGALYALSRYDPTPVANFQHLRDLYRNETDLSVLLALVETLVVEQLRVGSTNPGATAVQTRPNQAPGLFAQMLSDMTLRIRGSSGSSEANAHDASLPLEMQAAAFMALGSLGDESTIIAGLKQASRSSEASESLVRASVYLPQSTFDRESVSPEARVQLWARAAVQRGDIRVALRLIVPWGTVLGQTTQENALLVPALDVIERLALVEYADQVENLAFGSTTVSGANADRAVRLAAFRTLGALGELPDPTRLAKALAEPATRDAALTLCAKIGGPTATALVAPLLDASWANDRIGAANALGSMGGAEAFTAVSRRLQQEKDLTVRGVLYHALVLLDPGAAQSLLRAVVVRELPARWAALELAVRTGSVDASIVNALRTTGPGDDTAATALLALAGALDLTTAFGSPSVRVRYGAVLGLGFRSTPTDGADEQLSRLLQTEDDESVRVEIVRALGTIDSVLSRETLRLLVLRENDQPTVAAVLAAAQIAPRVDEQTLWSVMTLLNDPRPWVRASIATALGGSSIATARGALLRVVESDVDAEVRGQALISLARVSGSDALATIRIHRRIAWSASLVDAANRAEAIASGVTNFTPFVSSSVSRLSGVDPGAVFVLSNPDGSVRMTTSAPEGEMLVPGAPTNPAVMEQVVP